MSGRRVIAALALLLACSALLAATVGAQSSGGIDDSEPAFVVALQPDGSADLRIRYAFDLADGARADAFEELRTNETATAAFEARFRDRMEAVAADAAAATGRNVTVEDVELSLSTAGETGLVELSVTWRNLAAVEGDRLTVTEPFASGFEPDRPVHVLAPAGYEIERVAPDADRRDGDRASWAAGADLSGFEVVLDAAPQTESGEETAQGGDTDGASGPGFGPVAALLGGGLALCLLARRR